MSIKVGVNNTLEDVSSIYTFAGSRKAITSVWTFVNGAIKQLWPTTEVWTLVASYTNGQDYSLSLGFGKYKAEMSGGGGSGSSVACRTTESMRNRSQQNGFAGEFVTTTFNIPHNQTKIISGKVGTGAAGSSTSSRSSYHSMAAGTPGTGYANGSSGTTTSNGHNPVLAAGSGGGSTSLFIDGVQQAIAKGGKGGNASIQYQQLSGWQTLSVTGGAGGSGGTTSGTGAAGGAASYGAGSGSANTSGAGSNGYVNIYKSNIYPT